MRQKFEGQICPKFAYRLRDNTAPVKITQAISDIDPKFASRGPVKFNGQVRP